MAGRCSGPNTSDCDRPVVTDLWLLGWPTPRVVTGPKRASVRTAGALPPRLCHGSFHRVLHRTYSHSYPQAVRDFSQPKPSVRQRVQGMVIGLAPMHSSGPSLTTVSTTSGRARLHQFCLPNSAIFRAKLTGIGGFSQHGRV